MASFNTSSGTGNFRLATPDGMVPEPQRKLHYAVEHRPYSNVDIVDIGGYGAGTLNWPIIILAADIGAMRARLGETGTLTETSFSETATMLGLDNVRKNFDGTHYWADAFWVLSN